MYGDEALECQERIGPLISFHLSHIPGMTTFAEAPVIPYEGLESKNPLAFKRHQPDELVEGKTMRDRLRFSVAYLATLAGHSMHHECEAAATASALGLVDANTGNELIGWNTDQFLTNVYVATSIMLTILNMEGFTTGGLNFDAKVRRESFELLDPFMLTSGA